jgi:hypothetical protein
MNIFSSSNAEIAVAQTGHSVEMRHPSDTKDARIGGGPVVRCPTWRHSRSYAPGRHRREERSARSRKSSGYLAHDEAQRRSVCLREWA